MQQALAKANEIYLNVVNYDNKSLSTFAPSEKDHPGIVLDFAHNLKEELIRIDLGMTLNETLVSEVSFHYEVRNLNRFYEIKEGNIVNFNNGFISQLCGISYATLRGLLLVCTENKSNVLLPIIDPILIVETFQNKKKLGFI